MKLKLIFASFICVFFAVNSALPADYNAALVADMDSGKVLYQENANVPNYPASLTKIMTLYLTFDALQHDRLRLDDYLIVSQSAANASPVILGLAAGSKIKVEDAIKAVAVLSANDVARVLAENLKGGKEGSFASMMTSVATEIGLSRTNFENSSGLPDDDQLSTARDIALLSMAVYKHFPQYWKYFGIQTWTYDGKTYKNGNRLLNTYPGCDGMKTGYTNKSKYSLVATAHRGNHHLISVVLGAKNKDVRAAVSAQMLNRGFATVGESAIKSKPVNVSYQPALMRAGESDSDDDTAVFVSGNCGVQFGAFSSMDSAKEQQNNVKKILGTETIIEQNSNGVYRVRAKGLSEASANVLKDKAKSGGIDCFIFR